jgi:hypothetical protein
LHLFLRSRRSPAAIADAGGALEEIFLISFFSSTPPRLPPASPCRTASAPLI